MIPESRPEAVLARSSVICDLLVQSVQVFSFDQCIQMAPGSGGAAHIHEGAREAGKFPTGEAGIVQRILKNPKMFYVNVHPGGAVRGQLVDTADHKH
jgi:hypothetical protein